MAITDEELGQAIGEDRCVWVYLPTGALVDTWLGAERHRSIERPESAIPSDARIVKVHYSHERRALVACLAHPAFEPARFDRPTEFFPKVTRED